MRQPSCILCCLTAWLLVFRTWSLPTNMRGSDYLLNSGNVDEHPILMQARADSVGVRPPLEVQPTTASSQISGQAQPSPSKSSLASSESLFARFALTSPWMTLHLVERARGGQATFRTWGLVGGALLVLGLLILFVLNSDSVGHETEPKSYADLCALKFSTGTWAQTFQDAEGSQKEPLELLFRCNIIPISEFADSVVSREHIDECVWIATHMLKQKSLEEWVANWRQAGAVFDESVHACFTARTDVRAHYGPASPSGDVRPSLPEPLRSEVPSIDCHADFPSYHSSDPLIASNASTVVDIRQQGIPDPTASRGTPAAVRPTSPTSATVPSSGKSSSQNALVNRCREIMAQSDRERPPGTHVVRNTSTASTVRAVQHDQPEPDAGPDDQ